MDDTGLTLAHTAAMTNNLSVIVLLVNEGSLPLQALQLPDENLVSPAMVAIQVCNRNVQIICMYSYQIADTGTINHRYIHELRLIKYIDFNFKEISCNLNRV